MILLQDVTVIVLRIVMYCHINFKHDSVTRRQCDCSVYIVIYGHINLQHDSVTRRPSDGFACSKIHIWSHKLQT